MRVYDKQYECGCMEGEDCFMPCYAEYRDMKKKENRDALELHKKCMNESNEEEEVGLQHICGKRCLCDKCCSHINGHDGQHSCGMYGCPTKKPTDETLKPTLDGLFYLNKRKKKINLDELNKEGIIMWFPHGHNMKDAEEKLREEIRTITKENSISTLSEVVPLISCIMENINKYAGKKVRAYYASPWQVSVEHEELPKDWKMLIYRHNPPKKPSIIIHKAVRVTKENFADFLKDEHNEKNYPTTPKKYKSTLGTNSPKGVKKVRKDTISLKTSWGFLIVPKILPKLSSLNEDKEKEGECNKCQSYFHSTKEHDTEKGDLERLRKKIIDCCYVDSYTDDDGFCASHDIESEDEKLNKVLSDYKTEILKENQLAGLSDEKIEEARP